MIKRMLFLLGLLMLPGVLLAQTYTTHAGYAEFTGHTPLFSFKGSAHDLHGTINLSDSVVSFRLPVKSIDTGNNKRNRDMRKALKTKKNPNISFSGKIINTNTPKSMEKDSATVRGTFSVHGVSRQVTIRGLLKDMQDSVQVRASWPLNITDYNIKPPHVLFYSVEKRIDIHIEAVLKK